MGNVVQFKPTEHNTLNIAGLCEKKAVPRRLAVVEHARLEWEGCSEEWLGVLVEEGTDSDWGSQGSTRNGHPKWHPTVFPLYPFGSRCQTL